MSWKACSLAELGYVARGRSRHRPRDAAHLYGGPYPFVQTGDVKHSDLYVTSWSQTYSEAGLAQSRLWPKGTLCITIAANIAETAILGFEACFPDSVIGFLADPEKCDARFVKYKLDILKHQYQQFSQGAAQDNLSQEKLLSVKLLVPNLSTQRRIADNLSAYDDLIENNRRRIQLLEQAARLIYQEWFVQLRFPGHEHVRVVDRVPEGWELAPLSNALILQRGYDLPSADRREGTVPVLASTGVAGTHDSAKVRGPGVVTGRSGTLGVVTFEDEDFWPLNTALWVKEFKRVSPYFAYFMLREMRLEQYNGGASVPTLDRKAVHRVPVLIPPASLVQQFDEQVRPIFRQGKVLGQLSAASRSARDLLLLKLMSGEIEV